MKKIKVGLILTYNCEQLVQKTIDNIPKDFFDIVISSDDGSTDETIKILENNGIPTYQHKHMGYGGNLYSGMKIAFQEYNADYVYELHGDAQYDFNSAIAADKQFTKENSDLILGNRFYKYKKAIENGMPLSIFFGNIFFSFIAGILIGLYFRDLFPGFRAYNKSFFLMIKDKNFSWDYRFSFEIIAISKIEKLKIGNVPTHCDYKGLRKTPPYSYAIKAFINIVITGFFYRLAGAKLKYKYFKNENSKNSK